MMNKQNIIVFFEIEHCLCLHSQVSMHYARAARVLAVELLAVGVAMYTYRRMTNFFFILTENKATKHPNI
jgi:hypothetical protein